MALKVWLVRHGQSTANAGQLAADHGSSPLTELGRRQAEAVAATVAERPDLVAVSPFLRARQTAQPIIDAWTGVPVETWPIQEFTYLSPARYSGMDVTARRPHADAYWQRADPAHRDADDAESFAQFADRLRAFHERLQALDGFVVVVGHGQFFHAYKRALEHGLVVDAAWMREFRRIDLLTPLANGQSVAVEPLGVALVRS